MYGKISVVNYYTFNFSDVNMDNAELRQTNIEKNIDLLVRSKIHSTNQTS